MESGLGADRWIAYVQSHPFLAMAILLALGVLAYWRPKATFKLIGLLLVVGAIGYVLSFLVDLTSTGIKEQRDFMSSPRTGPERLR